jgi:hypothetical protein
MAFARAEWLVDVFRFVKLCCFSELVVCVFVFTFMYLYCCNVNHAASAALLRMLGACQKRTIADETDAGDSRWRQ